MVVRLGQLMSPIALKYMFSEGSSANVQNKNAKAVLAASF